MNLKLEVSKFELQHVKFNAKKGLVIDFYDVSTPNDLYSVDSDGQPHEDYHNALNKFKEVLAYSLGLNNGWDFSSEHNRKNEDNLKKSMLFWNDEIERCSVNGLTLVGSGDKRGIKIAGSLKTELGVVGLASPIIRFDSEFVNSIDETVMIGDLADFSFKTLQEEVWKFVFKQKRGGELFPIEEDDAPKGGLNVTMQKVS